MGIFSKDPKQPEARSPFDPVPEPAGPDGFGGEDYPLTTREEGALAQAEAEVRLLMPKGLTEPLPSDGAAATEGKKNGNAKRRWSLLPWDALAFVVDVFDFGATKHAPHNWKLTANGEAVYNEALLRHVANFQQGVYIDPESGKPTLAHIAANALICLWFAVRRQRDYTEVK
jgi:hypothetical protein